MSFSTFKTLLKNWVWRSDDTVLDGYVDEMSLMAEARLNREMRHRKMLKSTNVTFTPPAYPQIPSDYLELRSLVYGESASTSTQGYRFCTPEQMNDLEEQNTHCGYYFTIDGTDIRLTPVPSVVASGTQYVTLRYYGAVPVFSTADSSWVYDDHPDLYLYACLTRTGDFIDDSKKLAEWEAIYQRLLSDVNAANMRQEFGPRPVMRTRIGKKR